MTEVAKEKKEEKIKTETPDNAEASSLESQKPVQKKKRKFVNKKFGGKRGGRRNTGRVKSEYDQKIISLRRVTRVVAGGRRFSFSVAIVIGDRRGSVGLGLGKSTDTSLAIEKAVRNAKKNMIRPNLTKTHSIPLDVEYKYSASNIMMVPAPGKGLKAGGAMRTVLELLGAKDVTGKILSRSKNHANNAKATIEALKKIGFKAGSGKKKTSSKKNDNKTPKRLVKKDKESKK